MQQRTLDTDYLVIGSGAVGMAFTDVILAETDARLVLVDLHDRQVPAAGMVSLAEVIQKLVG